MRDLVYRVHPLPEALLEVVWDYGRLTDADEKRLIATMLSDPDNKYAGMETELVDASQRFIRSNEESYSVSLRDVRRYQKLRGWFYEKLKQRREADRKAQKAQRGGVFSNLARGVGRLFSGATDHATEGGAEQRDEAEVAVVLALAHCYHSRLMSGVTRDAYRQMVATTWESAWGAIGASPLSAEAFANLVHQVSRAAIDRAVFSTAGNLLLRRHRSK
jgi:hypothetical protein